jgi:hypothetical protein
VKFTNREQARPPSGDDAIAAENRKLRMLKAAVDTAYALIVQADLTIDEALDIVNATKRRALTLFPDKEHTYDLIYGPRLLRAVAERFARSSDSHKAGSADRLPLNT